MDHAGSSQARRAAARAFVKSAAPGSGGLGTCQAERPDRLHTWRSSGSTARWAVCEQSVGISRAYGSAPAEIIAARGRRAVLSPPRWFPRGDEEGTRCGCLASQSVAAPATVGGQPRSAPSHWETGKAGPTAPASREPGDLPSLPPGAALSIGVYRWRGTTLVAYGRPGMVRPLDWGQTMSPLLVASVGT